MDAYEPVTGDYPIEERMPLLTMTEARRAVALLLHLAHGTDEGRDAAQLAHDLAARLPAPE